MFVPNELLSIKKPQTLFIHVYIPLYVINPIYAVQLPSL